MPLGLPDPFTQVSVCAIDLNTGWTIDQNADVQWPLTSIAKLGWVLALHRDAAAGNIDLSERILLDPGSRTPGPTGISRMHDPVELSLRDAAFSALSASDNACADAIWDRLGPELVLDHCAQLGMANAARHPMRYIYESMAADLNVSDKATALDKMASLPDERITQLTMLNSGLANAATVRDLANLLAGVWRRRDLRPERAALQLMSQATVPSPLRAQLDSPDISIFSKTGTLLTLRHEAGIVNYPDGATYAVAVCTRVASLQHVVRRDGALSYLFGQCMSQLRNRPNYAK